MDNNHENKSGNIKVGDLSHVTGVAIGHGARASGTQGAAPVDSIAEPFKAIYDKIDVQPDSETKEDAKGAAQKLEVEARKGEQADDGRVQRWFNFLAETSSDAFDVAVATFSNPVLGVGTVFKKIADRAKE